MKQQAKQKLREAVERWLRGEFRNLYVDHTSDQFLSAILVTETERRYLQSRQHMTETQKPQALQYASYDAGCQVFEYWLEQDCAVGGNGHHMAQNFQKLIQDLNPDFS